MGPVARTSASRARRLLAAILVAAATASATAVPAVGAERSQVAEAIARELPAATRTIEAAAPPPDVSASGWIVYDAASAEPVAGDDAGTPRPIASLAKLMTALVVLERTEPDDLVEIPEAVNALGVDAARMDARPGERWSVADLLRAMLAHSANDAAIALAEHVSDGSEADFVELMNARAAELGMDDTEFASPTGLDLPGAASTSTPVDLVALTLAALEQEPIAEAVAMEQVELDRPGSEETIVLPNRNPLLGAYEGVDGVKTGFTDAAGYMLVAHHVDEKTDGELIVVTFASNTEAARVRDARALLDWARALRVDVRLVEGGTPYGSIPSQRGDRRVELFACDDLQVTVRAGQRFTEQVVVPRSVAAPVREGDEIGELRVRIGTPVDERAARLPASVPLCSGTSLPRRGRLERLRDHAADYRGAWRRGVDEVEETARSIRRALA